MPKKIRAAASSNAVAAEVDSGDESALHPPIGVVCSAGMEEACCCLVSLIQLPVTAIGTLKVALRSRTVDPYKVRTRTCVLVRRTVAVVEIAG